MSGIFTDAELADWQVYVEDLPYSAVSPMATDELKRLIAEIRRLRAENAELRASYKRVDRALNDADPATIWRPMKAKT